MSLALQQKSVGIALFVAIAASFFGSLSLSADEGRPASKPETAGGVTFRLVLGDDDQGDQRWIGVSCRAVDKAIREKLGLNDGEGLAIDEVRPNSPAAKAGLQAGDIILAAGKKSVHEVSQLAGAIERLQDGTLKLQIVRGSERRTVEVTPEVRSAGTGILLLADDDENKGKEELQKRLQGLLEQVRKSQQSAAGSEGEKREPRKEPGSPNPAGTLPGAPVRWRVMPGTPLAGAGLPGAAPSGLPADMDVTIKKHGSEPARIKVRQGDKKWSTTEKELDMLPPEARNYVARALGRPALLRPGAIGQSGQPAQFELRLGGEGGLGPAWKKVTPSVQPAAGGFRIEIRESDEKKPDGKKPEANPQPRRVEQKGSEPSAETNLDRQLQELQEQLGRLQREIGQLRRAAGKPQ